MSTNNKGGGRKGSPGKLGAKPRPQSKQGKQDKAASAPAFDFSDQPKLSAPRGKAQDPSQRPEQRLGEFTIDRLSHDGRGLSQWQGKTLFIEGALAGERVSARFVREQGRLVEARVDHVLEVAPERQAPPCPHYAQCGGCQWQHMTPEAQLAAKEKIVFEQLQRWAGLVPERRLPPVTSSSQGYRSCARMGVWYEKDGSVTLGFRQRQSKQLVQIEQCLVLSERLNQLLAPLHTWLIRDHSARAITHVELLDSDAGAALVLRHTKTPGERDLHGLRQLAREQDCAIWLDDGQQLYDLEGQVCDPRLGYQLAEQGLSLNYHPGDFIQVNPRVNQAMVTQALALLDLQPHEQVLDLFCGIGNFTLPLAKACAQVIGVEAVESMVERGRENAALAGLTNARFMAADLTKLSAYQLEQRCGRIDAVLLDPPRDGAKELVSHMAQLAPSRVLYVSCNPATLARDAKILAEQGYQLDAAGVLDMFPHTQHVESMALFRRRATAKPG